LVWVDTNIDMGESLVVTVAVNKEALEEISSNFDAMLEPSYGVCAHNRAVMMKLMSPSLHHTCI